MGLAGYVGQRLLLVLPMLVGVSLLTFAITQFVPTSPEAAFLSDKAQADPEIVAAFRQKWGLDRSLPEQYLAYMQRLAQGNLGTSLTTGRPVAEDLSRFAPATIELATVAMLVAILIGLPLGVYASLRPDSIGDWVIRVGTLLGVAVPVFWLAILGLSLLYNRLGWLPGPGRIDPAVDPPIHITGLYVADSILTGNGAALTSSLRHLIIPVLVLALSQLSFVVRVARSSMLDILADDYVRTAKAKGLHQRSVVLGHALRNALLPVVSYLGVAYGGLLSGAVVTETIFGWPGLGRYAFQGASRLDLPAILGVTLFVALVYIIANLAVDVVQAALDPRIRLRG